MRRVRPSQPDLFKTLPTYELPFLPDTVDLGGLYELADRLRDAGLHAAGAA